MTERDNIDKAFDKASESLARMNTAIDEIQELLDRSNPWNVES